MTDTTYNGWKNYETWVVNLWFDDAFTEQAEGFRDDLSGFADYIQERVEDSLPEIEGLAKDMLNASIGRVDWYEIAEGYVNDLPELEEEVEEEEELEEA